MKLTDKRFWIFEASTLLYAIGLMALGSVVWGKTASMQLGLFLACVCPISGFLTWLTANGKHWFIFGLIYEAVFLCFIAAYIIIESLISGATVFNDFWLDAGILLIYILTIGVAVFLPTMALAFSGYHLLRNSRQ